MRFLRTLPLGFSPSLSMLNRSPRAARTALVVSSLLASSLCGTLATGQILPEPRTFAPDIDVVGFVDQDGDGAMELLGTSVADSSLRAFTLAADGSLVSGRRLAGDSTHIENVQLADVDGDGQQDILALRKGPPLQDEIVVFYGRGSSEFDDPVPLHLVELGLRLLTNDFDLDGDVDLVLYPAADSLDQEAQPFGRFWVARNQGGGSFDPPQVVQGFVETLRGAAAIALDQDGDQDFVALRGSLAALVVVRNVGGIVQLSALTGSGTGYLDLDVGDVNADSLPDVVAFRRSSPGAPASIDLFLGNAAGSFDAPVTVLADATDLVADVNLGDFDGDLDLDIAVTTLGSAPASHQVLILAGNGQGLFTAGVPSSAGDGEATARCAVVDLNGDGRDDLFNSSFSQPSAGGPGRGFAFARLGQAAGSPANLSDPIDTTPINLVSNGLSGDLDGDGVLDFIARDGASLVWLQGTAGSNAFGPARPLPVEASPVMVADFDSDGIDEVLVVLPSNGEWRIVDSLGGGLFAPLVTPVLTVPWGGVILKADDFDGDGDLDIVATTAFKRDLTWIPNQGGFQFAAPVELDLDPLDTPGKDLSLGDFNGDGLTDVLMGTFAGLDYTKSWHANLGGGTLGPRQVIDLQAQNTVAFDLDQDGFDDIVWRTFQDPGVVLWRPGGPNGPTLPAVETVLDGIGEQLLLGTADIDADGLVDLITWLPTGEAFGYRRLPGTAVAFDTTAVVLSGVLTNSAGQSLDNKLLSLHDFGADGDLDLLVTGPLTSVWYENGERGSVGTSFCGPAVPNSTGASSRIFSVGTEDASANSLALRAADLPTNTFGFFIVSMASQPAVAVPASSGRLCLAGSVGRYVGPGQVSQSGPTGTFALDLDLTAIPQPLGFVAAQAGSTWFFQAWHRDTSPTGPTSNFTDGLQVTFE